MRPTTIVAAAGIALAAGAFAFASPAQAATTPDTVQHAASSMPANAKGPVALKSPIFPTVTKCDDDRMLTYHQGVDVSTHCYAQPGGGFYYVFFPPQ